MLENKKTTPAILQLTIDGIFKMYFEDPRNLPELRRFLKAYLELSDDDLSTIQILNPGLLKDDFNDKGFTVDLLLTIKSGDSLHIEMQTNDHTNFKERVQLCNARKAGQQVKVGETYSQVKRTISLVVTNFPVFSDNKKFHEKILMRREDGEIFTNVQELNLIDLTRVSFEEPNSTEKYLWAKLFQVTTLEELEMVAKESEEMAEAAEKLLRISADERAQAYALSRDNAAFARQLHEHGLREESRDKRTIEIIENGLKNDIPIETITIMTGLSAEEIEKLREDKG